MLHACRTLTIVCYIKVIHRTIYNIGLFTLSCGTWSSSWFGSACLGAFTVRIKTCVSDYQVISITFALVHVSHKNVKMMITIEWTSYMKHQMRPECAVWNRNIKICEHSCLFNTHLFAWTTSFNTHTITTIPLLFKVFSFHKYAENAMDIQEEASHHENSFCPIC